jgi:hypothetical protein
MAYMLQEIRQQPETLPHILHHSLAAISPLSERFRSARRRFVIIGARLIAVDLAELPDSIPTTPAPLPMLRGASNPMSSSQSQAKRICSKIANSFDSRTYALSGVLPVLHSPRPSRIMKSEIAEMAASPKTSSRPRQWGRRFRLPTCTSRSLYSARTGSSYPQMGVICKS